MLLDHATWCSGSCCPTPELGQCSPIHFLSHHHSLHSTVYFPACKRCCSWIGPALFNTSLEQGPILPSHVQDVVATAKHGSDTWVVPWGPW